MLMTIFDRLISPKNLENLLKMLKSQKLIYFESLKKFGFYEGPLLEKLLFLRKWMKNRIFSDKASPLHLSPLKMLLGKTAPRLP